MLTIRQLMEGPSTSPDGKHWEPSLPYPGGPLTWRMRDAWEVLMGRAQAIIQTPPAERARRSS